MLKYLTSRVIECVYLLLKRQNLKGKNSPLKNCPVLKEVRGVAEKHTQQLPDGEEDDPVFTGPKRFEH